MYPSTYLPLPTATHRSRKARTASKHTTNIHTYLHTYTQTNPPTSCILTMQSAQQPATSAGIALNHSPSDQGYKLIELPPDVVALLEEQSSSPTPTTLRLEATPTAGLLKTPQGKIWSLRQKNTSNALILLQAAATAGSSIDAIATVHETVELVPEAERAEAPTTVARGKWHEKFGKTR
ncbi:hypothetical protein BD289DRAFT_273140 [Coniella lustricola]|uniref:Uncharacterized protein n=1 Tax=Coniella lustricola TaxID=2025994 RepID=A0A2T3AKR0_9PEZI|nr:hypothetical protein BD289DRAFT_273140 [Coniella lustricola]